MIALAHNMPSSCWDAAPILGLGLACNHPLPRPNANEVIIRVGAWSLHDLWTCATVVQNNYLWGQEWYQEYPFARLIPGIYRVRLFIPESNGKDFTHQKKLLYPGERVGRAALVVATLVCLFEAGQHMDTNIWIRCEDEFFSGNRLSLEVSVNNRIGMNRHYDHHGNQRLWLASYSLAV